MNRADFVGLGFCSNDYLAVLPEIPIDNKLQMLEHLVQGGGPAATAAVAAARLGVSASFIGIVGDDDPGKRIIRDFESENVFTEGIKIREGAESAVGYCWRQRFRQELQFCEGEHLSGQLQSCGAGPEGRTAA